MNPAEGELVNVLLGSLKGTRDDMLVELVAGVVRGGSLNGSKELDRVVEVTGELLTDDGFTVVVTAEEVTAEVVTVEGSVVTAEAELEPARLEGRGGARRDGEAVGEEEASSEVREKDNVRGTKDKLFLDIFSVYLTAVLWWWLKVLA